MKKLVLFFAVAVIALSVNAQEEEKKSTLKDYHNYFSFQPMYLVTGTFQVDYERTFAMSGLHLSGGATLVERDDYNWIEDNNIRKIGWNAELQYRYYFNYSEPMSDYVPPTGIYMAPYFRYSYIDIDQERLLDDPNNPGQGLQIIYKSQDQFSSYSGGILFGLKLLFAQRGILDFYLGGGLKYAATDSRPTESDTQGILSEYYTGVIPKVGFKLGVAF